MAGVLTRASGVRCVHGGTVVDVSPTARVLVQGQPLITLAATFVVVGCVGSPPCVSAQFTNGTERVRASGVPLVTAASGGISLPGGEPLVQVHATPRVRAR